MKNLTQLYQKYLPFYQKYFGLVFRIIFMILIYMLYKEISWSFYSCSYSGNFVRENGDKLFCIFQKSFDELETIVVFLAVSYVLSWFARKQSK